MADAGGGGAQAAPAREPTEEDKLRATLEATSRGNLEIIAHKANLPWQPSYKMPDAELRELIFNHQKSELSLSA